MKYATLIVSLLVVGGVLLGGCDKKPDEATGGTDPDKAGAAEPSGGTGVDGAKLEEAYQSTFGDMKRTDGFDDKLKDLKAKIGEPQKTEGKDMFWWGWNAKDKYCREIKIITGAGGMMKTADKSKCGK